MDECLARQKLIPRIPRSEMLEMDLKNGSCEKSAQFNEWVEGKMSSKIAKMQ